MKDCNEVSLEELEKNAVIIDHLILDFPLDIRSTYFWKTLKFHRRLGCCCCCHSHHGHTAGPAAPIPGGSTPVTPTPTPTAPQVTLNGTAFVTTVVGSPGGSSARVDFDWNVTGGSNITVDIEVRTVQQYNGYNWTPVTNLRNQPPTGRGIWWGFGLSGPGMMPGFNYEARAVAKKNGVVQAYSNVVTF